MAGLNPLFVLNPPLQEVLFDKDTGLPLSGGIVTFYVDNGSETVLKQIYELSGNPTSGFTYTQLPNPLILNLKAP